MKTSILCFLIMSASPAFAQEETDFELNIVLSDKAESRLAGAQEAIVVDASYYGDPKPSAEKHANRAGQIDVGNVRIEAAGKSGHVLVGRTRIRAKRLKWLAGPMMVNVNLYTTRKSSPENLLACDFVDRSLADVRRAPVTLRCALIGERPDTASKP